jgi:hypothetical protein
MFSVEIGKDYFIPKSEATPITLDLNVSVLRDMGGEYVLSALPLANASDLGLTLIHTAENQTSPYRLHVYRTHTPHTSSTGSIRKSVESRRTADSAPTLVP